MSNKNHTGHPDARKTKYNPLAWINLVLLGIIVIACNYIGCLEYGRRDLSQAAGDPWRGRFPYPF